jgi:hypothetical protein
VRLPVEGRVKFSNVYERTRRVLQSEQLGRTVAARITKSNLRVGGRGIPPPRPPAPPGHRDGETFQAAAAALAPAGPPLPPCPSLSRLALLGENGDFTLM